jgi:hypothetical protein
MGRHRHCEAQFYLDTGKHQCRYIAVSFLGRLRQFPNGMLQSVRFPAIRINATQFGQISSISIVVKYVFAYW